ncbi:methyltransferase domain-containing protein [Pontibacterium granulatum]|uniref:class I SAM-dependent methyltransferase n=1 Tax=Pontibacterium granulatum TaxID=2036029 RepID=UPI00249A20CB|nr:methyltransferase domain-containing protein [Pontibacterium granulatum]MDI3326397.1 methyltransferase domain-containing protein [Pontibacterium granulatum]
MSATVNAHYQQNLDTDRIIAKLQSAYPEGPDRFQLAPVDQLHIGGIKASLKLVKRIAELDVTSILDIGSGLGGLMRLIEQDLKLSITGLDITHGLNQINQQLSSLAPSNSSPQVITGDAHNLPFKSNQFDLIVFQHSLLNMPDAVQVLRECKRVLTEHGQLLMHEVLQGENHSEMRYPVPWARNADDSHLRTESELLAMLSESDFEVEVFNDWSEEALAWRQRQAEKEKQSAGNTTPPPVSPALILGPEFGQMGPNVIRNLSNRAARVVEVIARDA